MSSALQIKPAVRTHLKVKIGFMGTAGTGKTLNALSLATSLGERVVGIDSERGRMVAYAGDFKFDHLKLPNDSPETYVAAIELANDEEYDVIIVDSISHEWAGKEGVLASVDRFGGWKAATPRHDEFIDTLFRVPRNVICTMRAKTHYTQEEVTQSGGGKKQEVIKLGVGPIQRDNVEYEFDLLGMFDLDHTLRLHKSVIRGLHSGDLIDPGDDPGFLGRFLAERILSWVNEGEPPAPIEAASEREVGMLRALLRREGFSPDTIDETFRKRRLELGALTPEYVSEQTEKSLERLRQRGLATEDIDDQEEAGEAQTTITETQEEPRAEEQQEAKKATRSTRRRKDTNEAADPFDDGSGEGGQ